MDPFSGEGGLLNISTAFHTHDYQTVSSYDTAPLSLQNRAAAQILKYRAQIALGKSRDVLYAIRANKDISSRALRALAQYHSGDDDGLQLAEELADTEGEDTVVQICCGSVLASAGRNEKAIELLSKHQGSLEAVALLTQIQLSQNRTDLALKEVQAAKRWAQDSLLINLAEAWVGMRIGGEKYQSTFYVYEELATAPAGASTTSLIGQAVAELHLGRLPEAETALQQALQTETADPQAVANSVALASIMGKKPDEYQALIEQLRSIDATHAFLKDLEEKSNLFDTAAAKYSARVVS